VIRIRALKFGQDTRPNDKLTFAGSVLHMATVVDAAMGVDLAGLRVVVCPAIVVVAAWLKTDIDMLLHLVDAVIAQPPPHHVDAIRLRSK